MMSTAFSTPVRQSTVVSELSNESPLPTPPRAMHDLIRNGRTTGGHSSNNNRQPSASTGVPNYHDNVDGHTLVNEMDDVMGGGGGAYMAPLTDKLDQQSSSPSLRNVRATTNNGQRPFSATLGPATGSASSSGVRRDSSSNTLAASLGTSLVGHRSALGSQMGISDAPGHREAATTVNVLRTSNKRATHVHNDLAQKSTESRASGVGVNGVEKENVDLASGGNKAESGTMFSSSVTSRATDKRSPALASKTSFERPSNAFSRSTYRRTSAELGNATSARQAEADVLRRSSDEGRATSSANSAADVVQTIDAPLQTPSMQSGSRMLRSAHTVARTGTAPWSVGRPMKRLDRHSGLDKPPQRVVATAVDLDEDEDEEAEGYREEGAGVAAGSMDRRMPSTIAEERDSETLIRSADSGKSSSAEHLRESGGRDERHGPIAVPLGADDEDEDEDGGQLRGTHSRSTNTNGGGVRSSFRSTGANVAESAQRRRTAINDILAAKVPSEAGPRRVLAATIAEPEIGIPPLASAASNREGCDRTSALSGGSTASEGDFMSLVRREAERQRNSAFIEQVRTKPSKDLETKFNGFKFKKVRKAGEGGFSTVWIVHGPYASPHPSVPGTYVDVPDHEQAYFAMKQVTLKKMEQVSREEVLEECNLLHMLASKQNNEEFILRFFGWKSSTGSLKILLELGEHDFNQILRAQRLTHEQITTYWLQMVQAVHFTHEQGNIVHTDLKPANFLMANGRLKLIDFGIAQKIPVGTIHIKRDAMIGTPNYMAPETVRAVKEGRNGRPAAMLAAAAAAAASSSTDSAISRVYKAGKASDVWALGCILYQMVYGRPPFEAHHGDEKLRQILDPKHVIDFSPMRYGPPQLRQSDENTDDGAEDDEEDDGELENVDVDLLDVMKLALTYSATDRITIPELLRHPLLRSLEQSTRDTQRTNHRDDDDDGCDEDVVPLTRDTLRDVLHKMFTFAMNGELHENNIDARADALFDNMLQRHRSASR